MRGDEEAVAIQNTQLKYL